METLFHAICNDCNEKFVCYESDSASYHTLHCEICGKECNVAFDDTGIQFLSCLVETNNHSENEDEENFTNSFEEHRVFVDGQSLKKIDKIAGLCECGGHFRLDLPVRCPRCGSMNYREAQAKPFERYK